MAFFCVLIQTKAKTLNPCYTRSLLRFILEVRLWPGEFDDGGKNIDFRTTQV